MLLEHHVDIVGYQSLCLHISCPLGYAVCGKSSGGNGVREAKLWCVKLMAHTKWRHTRS